MGSMYPSLPLGLSARDDGVDGAESLNVSAAAMHASYSGRPKVALELPDYRYNAKFQTATSRPAAKRSSND